MNEPLNSALREIRRLAASEPGGVSDAELLHRFIATREEAAFELLVWRHGRLVLGVCRRVLGDAHAAEDAFQATFLALARRAATIGRGEAVAAWLYRVALRAALRARTRATAHPHLPAPAEENAPPSSEIDPADAAAWRELRPILDDEVGRLPEKYRTPIVLCYLEGKTYDEAARDLGCARGTVSIRLTRARELLRKRLVRRGVALPATLFAVLAAEADASAVLVKSTVQLSVLYAAGTVAAVPGPVLALTEGVLRTMSLPSLKRVALGVVLAAVTVTTVGIGGVLAQRGGKVEVPVAAPDPLLARNDAGPSWHEQSSYESKAEGVSAVTFSPDGKRLAFVDENGTIGVLDVASGKLLSITETNTGPLVSAAFSPDGRVLAVGGGATGKPAALYFLDSVGRSTPVQKGHDGTVTSIAFSPDGKLLATAGVDGTLRLSDVASGNMLRTVSTQKNAIFSAAFSPDGRLLLTAGGDEHVRGLGDLPGELRVWDVATGKGVQQLSGHTLAVASAAFSPDGRTVASGSFDKTVRLWDAQTGKEATVLKGHEYHVRSLAFSPDGKLLVTGSLDETARIWDVATGKEIAMLRGHRGFVTGVAFSPDGKWIATCTSRTRLRREAGSGDAKVKIWQVGPRGTVESRIGGLPLATDDRLGLLVGELIKSQRGDEACVEALTLATLGRLPTEAERKFAAAELGRSQDRRKTLGDVLFTLTSTKEFRAHAADLARRAAQK